MRKIICVFILLAVCLLNCGCTSVEWSEGIQFDLDTHLCITPKYLESILPDDRYSEDMVLSLSQSSKLNDKNEYKLIMENYELYGRYDGLAVIVYGPVKLYSYSDEAFFVMNYGINQTANAHAFEIYSAKTSQKIAFSLNAYVIDSISDGTNLYVLCSDGTLLLINENGKVTELPELLDLSENCYVTLSGNSKTLSIIDYSENVLWSENIKNIF